MHAACEEKHKMGVAVSSFGAITCLFPSALLKMKLKKKMQRNINKFHHETEISSKGCLCPKS